jgi:hypothetical protein
MRRFCQTVASGHPLSLLAIWRVRSVAVRKEIRAVSEMSVRSAAGGPRDRAAAPGPSGRVPSLTPVGAVIAAATAVSLALLAYQLSRPGYLLGVTEYDDGSYVGSALRLVHGDLIYRDFIFVAPPGITLLMAPAALLSKLIGTTAWTMGIGRIMTGLAAAGAVVLGGLLVRHRGLLAVIVTCGVLAVYPDTIAAAHTVLLEPWLVLFCLAGAVIVFDGDKLTGSTRRLIWGGVVFGLAGAIQTWAIFPVVVILALSLPRPRRALRYAAGVAAGFLVPVVPFAVLAPRRFYQGLVVAQIGSRAGSARVADSYRLRQMLGLVYGNVTSHAELAAAALALVVVVLAMLAGASLITRALPPPLEWFALGSAALVVAAFLWPDQFHFHFASFFAPFLALSIALPASRLLQAVQAGQGSRPGRRWLGWPAAGLAGAIVIVLAVVQANGETHLTPHANPPAAADRIIPPGACVLTDEVAFTVLANRFVSDVPGCSLMVDGLGTDLALSHGLKPSTGAGNVPAVAALWRGAFDHAQYVWLTTLNARRIPWTPALRAYFSKDFAVVLKDGRRDTLYARRGLRPR